MKGPGSRAQNLFAPLHLQRAGSISCGAGLSITPKTEVEKIFPRHLVSLISWSQRWFTLEMSPGTARISVQLAARRRGSRDLSEVT